MTAGRWSFRAGGTTSTMEPRGMVDLLQAVVEKLLVAALTSLVTKLASRATSLLSSVDPRDLFDKLVSLVRCCFKAVWCLWCLLTFMVELPFIILSWVASRVEAALWSACLPFLDGSATWCDLVHICNCVAFLLVSCRLAGWLLQRGWDLFTKHL